MSEQQQDVNVQSNVTQGNIKYMENKIKRNSKLPTLLALLSLSCTFYIAYEGTYGVFGIKNQINNSNQQQQQIVVLSQQNQQLQQELAAIQQVQLQLQGQIHNVIPNQTMIIIAQLGNLIGAANQSLILYHDNAATIKLLGYALQLLTSNSDPQFSEVKINITKNIDQLQAISSFDSTIIGTKLETLYQLSNRLNLTSVAAKAENNLQPETNPGMWQRFVANFKQTILGMIKVEEANSTVSNLIPQNDTLLRQHLQLDILNAKQAFLSRNQFLWQQSINDAFEISNKYFVNDQFRIEELQILQELQKINLEGVQVNLDLTMQALAKLQQFVSSKSANESVVQ